MTKLFNTKEAKQLGEETLYRLIDKVGIDPACAGDREMKKPLKVFNILSINNFHISSIKSCIDESNPLFIMETIKRLASLKTALSIEVSPKPLVSREMG